MSQSPNLAFRLLLWLGVVYTANANRKFFGLPTTWVFHLTLNSILLFLPEILRGTNRVLRLDARPKRGPELVNTTRSTLEESVVENPNYAWYVAPVAFAYMVSHPHFNIYKGKLAQLRLFGFGLDALPHSLTAFTFTHLVIDTLAAFRKHTPYNARWWALAKAADEHSAKLAGAFLIAASALYESGEYAIHNEELRETGGDETKINLVWSAQDTFFDLLSNTLGWVAGALFHARAREQRRARRARVLRP